MTKHQVQPALSIIVPCFNSALTLPDLANDLAQLPMTVEVIFIDDFSGDATYEFLVGLCSHRPNFNVHRNSSNLGLSASRQTGLSMARGIYVWFVDSDDRIQVDLTLKFIPELETESRDLILFNASVFSDDFLLREKVESLRMYYQRSRHYAELFSGRELVVEMLKNWDWKPSACLYFTRAAFLSESGVTFRPGRLMEDNYFSMALALKAARVGYLDQKLYRRRVRSDSITMSSSNAVVRGLGLVSAGFDLTHFSCRLHGLDTETSAVLARHFSFLISKGLSTIEGEEVSEIEYVVARNLKLGLQNIRSEEIIRELSNRVRAKILPLGQKRRPSDG